jgi:putative ABC transport system permease protein
VIESAVAVVLLVGAGLLVRSLVHLQNTSPGFNAQNVLTMSIFLPVDKYSTPEKTTAFLRQLETSVAALPGVESFGVISELPLTGQLNEIPYSVEGRPSDSPNQAFVHDFRRVNTQYFKALQIPLLRGRNFSEQEVMKGLGSKVLVISNLLAKQVFPNEEAIGRRLVPPSGEAFEIIGVVGDIRHHALEIEPLPALYLPALQGNRWNLVIRVQGDPANLAAAVRHEVKAIDPNQPVADVKTMEDWLTTAVSAPRYRTSLLALFALIALVLASTGIYGVMSYSVAQRTHEIGVRMALGANRFDVLKLVVRQGMGLVVVGIVLGLFGAVGLTRVMSSLLFEVTPKDPLTFTAVALFLAFVAFVACYIPARRATRVDPLVALRYE